MLEMVKLELRTVLPVRRDRDGPIRRFVVLAAVTTKPRSLPQ
jgi:hypothetical protein